MAKRTRPDPVDELGRHQAGARDVDLKAALRSLPDDVDPSRVLPTVVGFLRNTTFWLGRHCHQLPVPVIRALLAETVEGPTHLFLRLAVRSEDATSIAAEWRRALTALLDLDLTYAWGSRQRRAKLQALARDPVILEAIQGTVAHTDNVKLDMLAVLVADGSAASFDALVRHVDPALVHRDVRLDRLLRLRTHATSTPALDALFAELDDTIDARNAESPALALAPIIGLGKVDVLWFSVSISSREGRNRVPYVQGHVRVDSRKARWFAVSIAVLDRVGNMKTSSFDATHQSADELGIGHCAPAELPAWLAGVARTLRIAWDDDASIRTGMRGAKRDRIIAWLGSAGR